MHWTRLEQAILRHHILSTPRTMKPDEQATTLLVIRLGLGGIFLGVLGVLLLIIGSKVNTNPLTLTGAILFVVAITLLGVASVAAMFLEIAHDN